MQQVIINFLFFFLQVIVMMKDQLLVLFKTCLAFKLATRENLYVKRGFGDMGIWFSFMYISNTLEKTLPKYFLKGFLFITCFNKSMFISVMLFLWLRLLSELNLSSPAYIAASCLYYGRWFCSALPSWMPYSEMISWACWQCFQEEGLQ